MNNFVLLLDLFSISIAFSVLIDETDEVEKNELNRIFNINYDGLVQYSTQLNIYIKFQTLRLCIDQNYDKLIKMTSKINYSGYLKANNKGTAQFHYMLYPAKEDTLKKTLILWLNESRNIRI